MDNWMLYYRRIGDTSMYKKIINIAIRDISRAFKIKGDMIKSWLVTPKSLGGFGLVDVTANKDWVSIKTIVKQAKYDTNDSLQGLNDISNNFGLMLTDSEKNTVLNSVVKLKNKNDTKVEREIKVINPENEVPLKPNSGLLYNNKPRWLLSVPVLLKNVLVARINKRADVFTVLNYLDEESKNTLLRSKSNASMGVVKEWLLSGFDYKVCTNDRMSTDFLSGANSDKVIILKRAMGMRNLTLRTIRRVNMYTEILTRWNKRLDLSILATGNDPRSVFITG